MRIAHQRKGHKASKGRGPITATSVGKRVDVAVEELPVQPSTQPTRTSSRSFFQRGDKTLRTDVLDLCSYLPKDIASADEATDRILNTVQNIHRVDRRSVRHIVVIALQEQGRAGL